MIDEDKVYTNALEDDAVKFPEDLLDFKLGSDGYQVLICSLMCGRAKRGERKDWRLRWVRGP